MRKNKRHLQKSLGFTLIETLAVIAIIAVLFVLVIPFVGDVIAKSKISGIEVDLRSYEIAVNSYLMEHTGDDFSEEAFNKYLDHNLRFENGVSKEKNPFGIPYFIKINEYFLRIYTVEDKALPKEFSIFYDFTEEEFSTKRYGFDNDVFGVPYCETNLISNPNYEYRVCYDKVIITNYLGVATSLAIPSQIDGKDVIAIEHSDSDFTTSFTRKGLNSVSLPNTLKVIGIASFADNNLISITIPNSVVTLAELSFAVNNLTSVNLPENLEVLSFGIFWDNSLTSISLPNTLSYIGGSAFESNKLSSVSIPSSVKKIEEFAFAVNEISNLTFNGDSLTFLGRYSFYYNLLTTLTIPNSLEYYGEHAFSFNYLNSVSLPLRFSTMNLSRYNYFTNRNNTVPIVNYY